MKKILLSLTAGLAFCLAGCLVPSVNPLYTEKDIIFDPALLGTWGKPDGGERWVFARDGAKAYRWAVRESESTNVFRAHLLTLGEHRFLDAVLVRTHDKWEGIGRTAVVIRPAHVFFKVEFSDEKLQLNTLDVEWLDKYLKENPSAIAHERLHEPDYDKEDSRVLLTASTPELQRFVLKHVATTNAFNESDLLPRLENAAGKTSAP